MVNRTAALHNLGCKVNAYETEAMRQMLEEAGYRIVPFAPGADVYIINTCSVTNIADRKSRQMLSRARKMNPDAVVVATGCYVQTDAARKKHLPTEADILIGNDRKTQLVQILAGWFAAKEMAATQMPATQMPAADTGEQASFVLDMKKPLPYEDMSLSDVKEHTRAFIKVQDGCNQFCSYCIIPYARGRIRSRSAAQTVEEIQRLTGQGIHEFVLTGIHLSSYGVDRAEETDLAGLVEKVACVPGVERIRLGSLEPGIVTEDFAGRLARVEQFCPQFHLSLQSGCDSVLRRMNRRYTTKMYEEGCDILRTVFDRPALTSDVIVGFPQETQEEFEATYDFLARIRLYETHIFRFSAREGTVAWRMDGQIPESVKAQRSETLIRLGEQNRHRFEKEWEGRPCEALFEEEVSVGGRRFLTGYTREYIRVYLPADEAGPSGQTLNTAVHGSFQIRDNTCIFHKSVLE